MAGIKKALVHMHSTYKSTTDLLSFKWVCGLFGYSIRLSVEIEAEPVKCGDKGLVKI